MRRTSCRSHSAAAGRLLLLSRPAPRETGFTLVEVLVALFVLSLGAASLLSLYAAAAATHRRASERTQAALFAEDVLATARLVYRPGMTTAEVLEAVAARLPPESGASKYELQLDRFDGDEFSEDELLARVRVRWRHEITAGDNAFASAATYSTILLPRARPGQAPDLDEAGDERSRSGRR